MGGFARVFQEAFKGMLYYVVIFGNHFDFIKWSRVYVECIYSGSSSFLDHGVFNQGGDFDTNGEAQ